MGERTITKKTAGTVGIASQAAALLLLAGVVGVFLIERDGADAGEATALSWDDIRNQAAERNAQLVTAKTEADAEDRAFDRDGVATRIIAASKVRPPTPEPTEPKPTVVADNNDPAPVEGPADDNEPQSRFLGLLGSGSTSWALVAVGESQKFIAPGETARFTPAGDSAGESDPIEVKVISVKKDEVELEEDGRRHVLGKAPRTAPAISVTEPAKPGPETTKGPATAATPRESGGIDPRLQAPRIQDFYREDGTFDSDAYREATAKMREERERIRRERLAEARERAQSESGEEN